MKRKLLISTLLFLTGLVTHAQDLDIKPSQQAQGILESKNGMVDHATGLFHYKVPLYEVKSGNFTLPISLNYVAKGVKVKDEPGLIGYNWTLNTGGIVTRTVRGGLPDEGYHGYIHNPLATIPTNNDIELVNKRERDGESDIFTASLNGQSVHFIIKKENSKIVAIPLQRTNVKIDILGHVSSYDGKIDGFIVTDDSGNKYTFMQKEMTSNITREGVIGINGINNKNYISSWYLSKIEPLNAKPIIYKYLNEVKETGVQSNIKLINYYQPYFMKYNYGRQIVEFPLDFSKYKVAFDDCINNAKYHIEEEIWETQLSNQLYEFQSGKLIRNPFYEDGLLDINANLNTLGILSDFSKVSNASGDIIQILYELMNEPGMPTSVVAELREAARLLGVCIRENTYIQEKQTYQGGTYSIYSPLLSQIEYDDKTIDFSYTGDVNISRILNEINQFDIYKQKIKGVKINDLYYGNKISYTDSNNNEYDYIKFEYYNIPSGSMTDLWGYYKKKESPDDEDFYRYIPDVNGEYAKYRSLRKISKKTGAIIELDYESNQVDPLQLFNHVNGFGGIRIKNIKIKNDQAAVADVIRYSYPEKGIYQYYSCRNCIDVDYGSFADGITYEILINNGHSWINSGNNGLYYPYVQEEFVGKGKNAYEFHVPTPYLQDSYLYWTVGIPTAKASYDANNKLTNVVKYNYYGDNHFDDSGYSSDNIISVTQVQAYEYYIDKGKIETQFRNQGNVSFGAGYYINPFNEIYTPNIEPRTSAILPNDQTYKLYYGGRTLLKEQIEYKFESGNSGIPSLDDFRKTSSNYKKLEYFYDDIYKNIYPTKIVQTNSNGSQNIEVIKRVIDITDNTTLIDNLKSRNIYSPILKTQKQIKRSGNSNPQLIEEKVYKYTENLTDGKSFMVLDEIHTYKPDVITNVTSTNNNLFSYTPSKYLIEKFNYEYENGNYLPIHIEDIKEKTLFRYDFLNSNVTLKSYNTNINSVMAVDYHKYKPVDIPNPMYTDIIKPFYDKYVQLNFDNCSPGFIDYINGLEHTMIIEIIKNIVGAGNRMSYAEIKPLITSHITEDSKNGFYFEYYHELQNFSPNDLLTALDILRIDEALSYIMQMTEEDYNNLVHVMIPCITNVLPNKNYKLYVLSDNANFYTIDINCIIKSDTKNSQSVTIEGQGYSKLFVFDIDLSMYNNISELCIDPYSEYIEYIALVPADAEFEATSYNADGTVFCKFNQNGQLERYEYDAAGRVKKIFDNDNNVLKEFNYNVVLPQ